MTPEEMIDAVSKLANLGLTPVALIAVWQLWKRYNVLIDDLRKINERLDAFIQEEVGRNMDDPPWD